VLTAFGKFGAIGYSPFAIERSVSAESDLAAVYRLVFAMAPMIAAHQGKDSMTAVRLNQGDAPQRVALGNTPWSSLTRGEAACRSPPSRERRRKRGGRSALAASFPARGRSARGLAPCK